MNILLIGKTGQLGGSILAEQSEHQFYVPGKDELDIASRQSCKEAITNYSPDVVINTAAFHNVPQCEIEPGRAFTVNCQAVRDLAALCKKHNSLFVTFSTDYVFDGIGKTPYQENDRAIPLQIYGISRLAGELVSLATAPEHAVIIRTCGLYGLSGASSKGGNFVDNRIADAQKHRHLEMGCDQVVSPTYARDLAQAVLRLIEHPKLTPGIYHLVNEGECSWYDFTKTIYEIMGIDVELIPVDRKGMSGEMRRPQYSALANTKARELGITLPHWKDSLQRYIHEKYESRITNAGKLHYGGE